MDNVLLPYLGTTDGMECLRNNSAQDDNSDTVQGVSWFTFNNVVCSNLYVSGNHWIGLGENIENVKVCRRDGKMWYLYRQEGMLHDYYHFLKIRWEGNTHYNDTSTNSKLVYEFFLFDTGDMFLNVVQSPVSNEYIGTSSLVCGGNTKPFTISAGSPAQVIFHRQDETGTTWLIEEGLLNIAPPYDKKYLIQDGAGKYYTVLNDTLSEVELTALSAQAFRENGCDSKPGSAQLVGLTNPKILYWQDSTDTLPVMTASVTAIPPVQIITSNRIDMSDESILGIETMKISSEGNVLIAISFDHVIWKAHDGTQWVTLSGDTTGMTKEQAESIAVDAWAEVATTGQYWIRFALSEGCVLRSIQVKYLN